MYFPLHVAEPMEILQLLKAPLHAWRLLANLCAYPK